MSPAVWVFSGSAASRRISAGSSRRHSPTRARRRIGALRVFAEARGQHSQGIGGRGYDCRLGLHRVFHNERDLLSAFFDRGEDQAVLAGEHVKQRDSLEATRDEVRDQARYHHRQSGRVVARKLDHHENRGDRHAQKAREERAHANQGKSADGHREAGKEMVLHGAHRTAQHSPDEEGGGEHAAGRAAQERDAGGEQFHDGEEQKKVPGELAVERLVNHRVACAHHLR